MTVYSDQFRCKCPVLVFTAVFRPKSVDVLIGPLGVLNAEQAVLLLLPGLNNILY